MANTLEQMFGQLGVGSNRDQHANEVNAIRPTQNRGSSHQRQPAARPLYTVPARGKILRNEQKLAERYGVGKRRTRSPPQTVRRVTTLLAPQNAFGEPPKTPTKRVNFRAPLRSIPFDEDLDTDPFEFFPEWQLPASALRLSTKRYQTEYATAKEHAAHAEAIRDHRDRGSPINIADLIQRRLRMGFYASPSLALRRSNQAVTPCKSRNKVAYQGSPMILD
ncbi:hypothetical protein LTR97_007553 [Elasticomyces elasticus]|uniref:Uncharacterized protein n=1 Tax=Elasticomyces elasticus TaxID=574655 RepID=A0AAN7WEU1_9PEZI|nr:hypothetical protein LTR97_007553 [Elasticomyces elasticus]